MVRNRRPETCWCGGAIVRIGEWCVCRSCGGAHTRSGKYLPPRSGWNIPIPPSKVVVWQNGVVMVFGPQGEQVQRYQGAIADVIARGSEGERLADLVPLREWKFRIWSEVAAGTAIPEWIAGRANEISAARDDFPMGFATTVANDENRTGRLLVDPSDI